MPIVVPARLGNVRRRKGEVMQRRRVPGRRFHSPGIRQAAPRPLALLAPFPRWDHGGSPRDREGAGSARPTPMSPAEAVMAETGTQASKGTRLPGQFLILAPVGGRGAG